jgi:hypothetical protein
MGGSVTVLVFLAFGLGAAQELRSWHAVRDVRLEHRMHSGRRLHATAEDAVPEAILLAFRSANRSFELDLVHEDVYAEGATVVVNQRGSSITSPAPRLRTYNSRTDGPEWAKVTIRPDGSVSALFRVHDPSTGRYDVLVVEPASTYGLHAQTTDEPRALVLHRLSDLHRDSIACGESPHGSQPQPRHSPRHAHHAPPAAGTAAERSHTHDAHGHIRIDEIASLTRAHTSRGLSELGTLPVADADGLYGRLSSCPAKPQLFEFKVGLVIDHGFATRVGGTQAAVEAEVASIVQRANAIYEDQVSVRLSLSAR